MSVHTNNASGCKKEKIHEISDICDNEYYLSALGPEYQNWNRARRGYERIKKYIKELEEITVQLKCEACIKEINQVLVLQRQARDEIKRVWDFSD